MLRFSVQSDMHEITDLFTGSGNERGLYALLNQMHADMNQFVPLLNSDLRQTSTVLPDLSGIQWVQPYAAKQFYEQMSNYSTPGTGSRWDLKAEGLYMDSWTKAYSRGLGL